MKSNYLNDFWNLFENSLGVGGWNIPFCCNLGIFSKDCEIAAQYCLASCYHELTEVVLVKLVTCLVKIPTVSQVHLLLGSGGSGMLVMNCWSCCLLDTQSYHNPALHQSPGRQKIKHVDALIQAPEVAQWRSVLIFEFSGHNFGFPGYSKLSVNCVLVKREDQTHMHD